MHFHETSIVPNAESVQSTENQRTNKGTAPLGHRPWLQVG